MSDQQPSVSIDEALQLFFAVSYPQGPPEGVDPEQFFALLKTKIAQDRPDWAAAHGETPPEPQAGGTPTVASVPTMESVETVEPTPPGVVSEPQADFEERAPAPGTSTTHQASTAEPAAADPGARPTYPYFAESPGETVGPAADQAAATSNTPPADKAEAPVATASTNPEPTAATQPPTASGTASPKGTATSQPPPAGASPIPGVPAAEPLPEEESGPYDRARAAIYAAAHEDEVPTDPDEKYFYERRKKLEAKVAERKDEERADRLREDMRRRLVARNNGRVDAAEIERALEIRQQLEARLGLRPPAPERPTLSGVEPERVALKTETPPEKTSPAGKNLRPEWSAPPATTNVAFSERPAEKTPNAGGLDFLKNLSNLSDQEKIDGLRAFNESRRELLKKREDLVYRRLEPRLETGSRAETVARTRRERLATEAESGSASMEMSFDSDGGRRARGTRERLRLE